jgi:hypothetical protein
MEAEFYDVIFKTQIASRARGVNNQGAQTLVLLHLDA